MNSTRAVDTSIQAMSPACWALSASLIFSTGKIGGANGNRRQQNGHHGDGGEKSPHGGILRIGTEHERGAGGWPGQSQRRMPRRRRLGKSA